MSEEEFAYSATGELLMALPVGEALKESREPECPAYSGVFFKRAGAAKATGNHEVWRAWALLAHLCRVVLTPSEPGEPFRPVWQEAGGRTFVPRDMDEESAAAVREFGLAVTDEELRSRLLDATWERLRDAGAAREAVRSYVEAANALFDPEHWTAYVGRIERAARLARQLRDKGLVDDVLQEVEIRVVELDGGDPLYMSCRLMDLLHDFERGDPLAMRDIAAKGACLAEGKGDFERARTWHDLVGRWCRRAGDDEGEKGARFAMAGTLHRQAEQCSEPGQELVAAHFMEKAHEAYRNIPGMRARADEIYAQLREVQRRSAKHMSRITTRIPDASAMIRDARDCVAGKPLREALLALATFVRVTGFEQETENARGLMEKYPLQSLFGGVRLDHSGLVVGRTRAAFTTDETEFERALWERVVQHVDLRYQLIAQTGIVPAINQLNFEHSLTLEDMVDIVVDNPFVPQGREELFARGFLAGFRWHLAEGLSILVPQLENALRHVLAGVGHEVTTRDKHGIQISIQMGRILSDHKKNLEAILGKDIVQELRILFADQNGADLRNQIAHGLMGQEQFFHHASIYAWWFIFHLTICPVRERFLGDGESAEHTGDRDAPVGQRDE